MPEETYGNRGSESMRSRLPAMALLFSGTLGISAAFGMLLLLPLYVQRLGGDEADFGVIMASATFTAALAIGLVIRYPEALRPNVVWRSPSSSTGSGRRVRRWSRTVGCPWLGSGY